MSEGGYAQAAAACMPAGCCAEPLGLRTAVTATPCQLT